MDHPHRPVQVSATGTTMPPQAAGGTLAAGFSASLQKLMREQDSLLCVGLDPDPVRLPRHLLGRHDAVFEFCRTIVDATADLVCAFKPQIAYFAAQRAEDQLEALIAHIHRAHPQVPVILDAKRGDIGPTAALYAREAFDRYQADAVTLSPYMGSDSIAPWLEWPDRGLFLLCRTSNPGGSDLQALEIEGRPLFEHVATKAATPLNRGGWFAPGRIGLVVGATFPAEIGRVRAIVGPDMPLLIPGIGAQGGDLDATLGAAGRTASIINSSRAILYAGSGEDFGQAARAAAIATRDDIRKAIIHQNPA
jgi:orotidine-5'-phosphate decarboxylase